MEVRELGLVVSRDARVPPRERCCVGILPVRLD
jgi:hypothetical protein